MNEHLSDLIKYGLGAIFLLLVIWFCVKLYDDYKKEKNEERDLLDYIQNVLRHLLTTDYKEVDLDDKTYKIITSTRKKKLGKLIVVKSVFDSDIQASISEELEPFEILSDFFPAILNSITS